MKERAETVARTYGRYQILEAVGHGTVGAVYKAYDPIIARNVALKVIRDLPDLDPAQREAFKARFRAEAEVAGSLHHPHIVTLYDVGDDYLVMEYLEGQLLDSLVGDGRALDPAGAVRLGRQLALAVDFAHSRGVVHREIKPANVMVLPTGSLKVMDFGVARPRLRSLGMAPGASASQAYAAPERLEGRRADARSDIYSLGMVVYEMLTGHTPFPATDQTPVGERVKAGDWRPILEANPDLPRHYEPVFWKVLARDPARRYASAREFIDALEHAGGEEDHPLLSLVAFSSHATVASPSWESPDVPCVARAEREAGPIELAWASPTRRLSAVGMAAGLLAALAGWLGWPRRFEPIPMPTRAVIAPARSQAPAATPTRAQGRGADSGPGAAEGPMANGIAGVLLITSTPPGARVFVAGVERGATPILLEHPIGLALVRVERSGYLCASRLAWVFPGRAVGLSVPLRLETELRRPVDVLSLPGGQLSIDGLVVGNTNALDLELAHGFHVIEVRRPGFVPWIQEIEVGPRTDRVIATLDRQTGIPARQGAGPSP